MARLDRLGATKGIAPVGATLRAGSLTIRSCAPVRQVDQDDDTAGIRRLSMRNWCINAVWRRTPRIRSSTP